MSKHFVDWDEQTPAQFVQLLEEQATYDKRMGKGWNCVQKILEDYSYSDHKVKRIHPMVLER